MPTIKRFEDLHCWQSSRELVNMVYDATNELPFNRDFGLRDQIRRAAVSVETCETRIHAPQIFQKIPGTVTQLLPV
jgi:hypothetical protein